jgi:hypothetical protein
MAKRSRDSAGRDGCGHLLLTCFAICFLLAVNALLVAMMFTWARQQGNHWVQQSKIAQGLVFLGPVALIFAEWWLVDLFSGRWPLGRRSSRRHGAQGE